MGLQRQLIRGVPFVSWGQAARKDYPDKEIVNPSSVACQDMLDGYLQRLGIGQEFYESESSIEVIEKATIDDAIHYISLGHPIMFGALALTPFAHPVSQIATMTGFKFPETCPYSSLLGLLAPLETIKEKEGTVPGMTVNESVYSAQRIGIGYDNNKRILILHCPTFGPAWEVSYEEFEQMWDVGGCKIIAIHPETQDVPDQAREEEYPTATIDQFSAFCLIYAMALSASSASKNINEKAEEYLQRGLAADGLSKGYEHLLLMELAIHILPHDPLEASERLKRAIELVPENPWAYEMLAISYWHSSNFIKSFLTRRKANALSKNRQSLARLAASLPTDFWVSAVANLRGWGYDNPTPNEIEKNVSTYGRTTNIRLNPVVFVMIVIMLIGTPIVYKKYKGSPVPLGETYTKEGYTYPEYKGNLDDETHSFLHGDSLSAAIKSRDKIDVAVLIGELKDKITDYYGDNEKFPRNNYAIGKNEVNLFDSSTIESIKIKYGNIYITYKDEVGSGRGSIVLIPNPQEGKLSWSCQTVDMQEEFIPDYCYKIYDTSTAF